MSVEATLKKQAREILAKDNWAKSIMGFLCVLSVFGITLLVVDLSTYLMTDDILSNPINIAIMVAISLVGVVGFVLLSPFYTGYIKFIAESKEQKTGDAQNFVYYFAKGRYLKTVLLNLTMLVRYAVLLIICVLPLAVFLVLMHEMPEYETGFKIGALWSGIVGAVVFFMISRFYVMVQYLYVSGFEYRKERELIKLSSRMIRKNFGKCLSLYISFIGYLLLCFFMIPIVFVYPYFKHTAILSYSYIYELEKSNTENNNQALAYNPVPTDNQAYITSNEINTYSQSKLDINENAQLAGVKNNINAQTNSDNISQNVLNFNNNQQTTQNAFIPGENSGIMN